MEGRGIRALQLAGEQFMGSGKLKIGVQLLQLSSWSNTISIEVN
jgi:hypothetical protein